MQFMEKKLVACLFVLIFCLHCDPISMIDRETTTVHTVNELQHNPNLLCFWSAFYSKRSAATYCFPDSSPPSSSMSPGRLCNAVPSSSFLLTTKTLFYSILFFFLSSLRRLILHMILGQWEAGHTGCGLQCLSTQL